MSGLDEDALAAGAAPAAEGMGSVVDRLDPQQQAVYWKRQARAYEQQAAARGDYDEVKADADRWRELQSLRDPDRVLEVARAQGAAQARWEALEGAVVGIVRLTLQRDGRRPQEVEAVLRGLRPGAFVGPDGVDHDALTTYLQQTTRRSVARTS